MSLLQDGDSINFQKASHTLDGCVKVYTSRIDSVDSETKKLLLGLVDKNEMDPVSAADDGEVGQAKKKRTANRTLTLVDNATISLGSFEKDFSADPLFQKTAADFDEGGAKGLLLGNLDISSTGRIIFDAADLDEEAGDASESLECNFELDDLLSKLILTKSSLVQNFLLSTLKRFAALFLIFCSTVM
jgi:condensin complex subunit 2